MKTLFFLLSIALTTSCMTLRQIPEKFNLVDMPDQAVMVAVESGILKTDTLTRLVNIDPDTKYVKSIWVNEYIRTNDTVIIKKIRRPDCLIYVVSKVPL